MTDKSIEVEILESTPEFVKVKLPFIEVPVQMNYSFFRPRVEKGYFKIKNIESNRLSKFNPNIQYVPV